MIELFLKILSWHVLAFFLDLPRERGEFPAYRLVLSVGQRASFVVAELTIRTELMEIMMKATKTLLGIAAVAALCAASNAIAAADDSKYPAYNFQPSVIFSNPELIEKTHGVLASTPAPVSAAPAAASTAGSSSAAPAAAPTAIAQAPAVAQDPKYPAAYFQPSILYPTH